MHEWLRVTRGRLNYCPVAETGVLSGTPHVRTIGYCESAVVKHKILAHPFVDHGLSERFQLLRAKIVAETPQADERTFLTTSTQNTEGKTFTAINLAITFAREVDHEVLLVDINARNPSVLKYLGIDEQPGLLDCLHDNVPLSDMLICPGIERFLLLSLVAGSCNTRLCCAHAKCAKFFTR